VKVVDLWWCENDQKDYPDDDDEAEEQEQEEEAEVQHKRKRGGEPSRGIRRDRLV
jgi:hypothetical protein